MASGSRRRYTELTSRETRQTLHSTARMLFEQRGWASFKRPELAAAAGVSTARSYYYVPSMKALAFSAFGEECEKIKEHCEKAGSSSEFLTAIPTHSWRRTSVIATALNPTTNEPWLVLSAAHTPTTLLTFENLADQLSLLIQREQSEQREGVELFPLAEAHSMARAKLYAVLTAIGAEDRDAVRAITLMQ